MKTALITGASVGIGAAYAQALAARQTNLVLVARSEDKLKQLAQELQTQFRIQTEIIVQDLALAGAAQLVSEKVSQKGLNIDILINNAGFGDYGVFTERDLSKQLAMIQLNITTLVELTHIFLSRMRAQNQGAIINIASIAGFQPLPYLSVYAATKAFVLNFTEALWAENKHTKVRILAVCPGPTESEFFKTADFPQVNYKCTPAAAVVRDSLKALENNQPNLVTGGLGNQIIVNLARFMPRELIVSIVEKQFRLGGKDL